MTTSRAARGPLLQRQQFLVLLGVAVLSGTLLIGYLLWSARVDALRSAQVTALNYARSRCAWTRRSGALTRSGTRLRS
jgi:hypothetical protein